MEEELEQAQQVYNILVGFLVNYSFQIVGAIIIMALGVFVAKKVSGFFEKLLISKDLDITLSHFSASFIKILIITMTTIIVLGKMGISITPFVATIGAVGLGAGFSLQGMLSNYAAGVSIIIARLFIAGDNISVRNVSGVVFEAKYKVKLAVFKVLAENNVEIPFLQRHVHLINSGD